MFALHRRRVTIAASVGAGLLLVLVAVGVVGLVRGAEPAAEPERVAHESSAPASSPTPVVRPRPIADTTDPKRFARAVTRALFSWDSRYPGGVSEWAQVVVDVADADEASAVAADVREYLPSPEYWARLADYGTRQWIDVESVVVPNTWSTALAQAAPGQIPADATAFTIVGVSRRAGTWGDEEMRTKRRVAFTLFVACPSSDPCVLLRLSRLDSPLD
ncbi:hypothetical protein ACFQ58_08765 [Agromyces sp. NPDC056523]|uniref:hypothetical protein n=1 Tax=Agromyces sp. NPDC056523 TaxID=3345850 RepID=UPI00366E2DB3